MFEVLRKAAEFEVVCDIQSGYRNNRRRKRRSDTLHAGDIAVDSMLIKWSQMQREQTKFAIEFRDAEEPIIEWPEKLVLLSYKDIQATLGDTLLDPTCFEICKQALFNHALHPPISPSTNWLGNSHLPGALFSEARLGIVGNDLEVALAPKIGHHEASREVGALKRLVGFQESFVKVLLAASGAETPDSPIKYALPHERILTFVGQAGMSIEAQDSLCNVASIDVAGHFRAAAASDYLTSLYVSQPYVQEI